MSEHIKHVHATVLDYLDTQSIDGFDTVVIQQDATRSIRCLSMLNSFQ